MTRFNQQEIKAKISKIVFSNGVSMLNLASRIIESDRNIGFSVDISGIDIKEAESRKFEAERLLSDIPGVNKVTIVLTSVKEQSKNKEQQKVKARLNIEGVKKVIVIAAGKGGVGKSTISALLAEKLTLDGLVVGLIDADIYGPSIPHIFNVSSKPQLAGNKMVPIISRQVQINSIGFLTPPGSSISWRGPMASKALYQLLSLTKWENLDYLIIDMPPGTGDIHLSLLENYNIDGVLMVTTPQKIAKIDVCRAIDLYRKFDIKILGIIENMSYIENQKSATFPLFLSNAGEEIADTYRIPLLAKLPINPKLAELCDNGASLINFSFLIPDNVF